MSVNAYLPCFVCGKTLPNAFVECDNQPYGGTEFATHGHYGSTFWDDFDGEALLLNVCDRCLEARKDRLGQQKRYLPIRCAGLVGFGQKPVDRPVVAYTGNIDDAHLDVDAEELGRLPGVQWVEDIEERRRELI